MRLNNGGKTKKIDMKCFRKVNSFFQCLKKNYCRVNPDLRDVKNLHDFNFTLLLYYVIINVNMKSNFFGYASNINLTESQSDRYLHKRS